jgi:hypothetical protein
LKDKITKVVCWVEIVGVGLLVDLKLIQYRHFKFIFIKNRPLTGASQGRGLRIIS